MEEDGRLVPLSACDQATSLRGKGGRQVLARKKLQGECATGEKEGRPVITDPQNECVGGRGKGRMALTDLATRRQAALPPADGVDQPQSRQVLWP